LVLTCVHRTVRNKTASLVDLVKEHLRVLREFLKVVVFIDGVVHPEVHQLLQGLVDEDDADERRESFLCEARDVTDERAGVRGHQQETEEGRPQADARPQGEVGEAVLPERDDTHAHTHTHTHTQE